MEPAASLPEKAGIVGKPLPPRVLANPYPHSKGHDPSEFYEGGLEKGGFSKFIVQRPCL